ncbi:MAG: DUF1801 domain-containing protein [Pseudomonadota bacterium]
MKKPPADVAAILQTYPAPARKYLRTLRSMTLRLAAKDPAIGELTETLKWSEPAYLTTATGAGSTLRMAWKAKQPDQVALYFNCNTTLVDTFRSLFPELTYEGNRAIALPLDQPLPLDALERCIAMTLTYHLRKASRNARARA